MAGITVTTLPSLPNPASHRNPSSAQESLRALRALGEGASTGAVEYPYPTTHDYPLPPLPPIPIPAGIRRRRVEPTKRVEEPIEPAPIVDSAPLASAVEGHGTLHFDETALLLESTKGWTWALLSRTRERADEVLVLGVRFFPTRDKRPPPIHALPPPGLGQAVSDHLVGLRLSVPSFLVRLSVVLRLLDSPCYRCNKYLSDGAGLPMCTGWLPAVKEKEKEKKDKGADELKDGKDDKETDKEKNGDMDIDDKNIGDTKDGRWVAWHSSCRPY